MIAHNPKPNKPNFCLFTHRHSIKEIKLNNRLYFNSKLTPEVRNKKPRSYYEMYPALSNAGLR
jgi:hypothetical protein